MTKTLLITATLASLGSSAFAQDTTPPVFLILPQNASVECDGTDSYTGAFNAWLSANANSYVTDDSGFVNIYNDYVPSVIARLNASGLSSANAKGAALQAQQAANTLTTSDVVAAADWLANECGELTITINFWAEDASGNSTYGGAATFAVVDTTAPTMNWVFDGTAVNDSGMYTTALKDLPFTATVTASDLCSGTYVDTRWTWGGATTAPTVAYSNGTFTVTGGVANTEIIFYAKAYDECGNMTTEEFIIVKIEAPTKGRGKLKGNEGLGNGVDPNTPGHAHNGGNDDPAFGPGNPGARYKNRL